MNEQSIYTNSTSRGGRIRNSERKRDEKEDEERKGMKHKERESYILTYMKVFEHFS